MTLDDAPRSDGGEGFSDALTFAFADLAADVCGVARLGVSAAGGSGLVLLFAGGEPVAVEADGEGTAGASWDAVRAAGVETAELEPGRRWRLRCTGDAALDLEFEAVAEPAALAADSDVGRAGGMEGFDHVCRVRGTVRGAAFEGRGQRGRSWGTPDWERMALARTITGWFDGDRAVSAVGIRGATAKSHADEAVAVAVFEAGEARPVADPRISTTYDAEGRQRAAGLELYVGEEDAHPLRAAGELAAGTSLDLGRLRLDCAFFRWRMGGREGVGRYDVLRRAE